MFPQHRLNQFISLLTVQVLGKIRLELNKDKVNDCHLCQQCSDIDKVKVESTGNIIFTLESWGQLSCKDLLSKSAEILLTKIEEMENLV